MLITAIEVYSGLLLYICLIYWKKLVFLEKIPVIIFIRANNLWRSHMAACQYQVEQRLILFTIIVSSHP